VEGEGEGVGWSEEGRSWVECEGEGVGWRERVKEEG
jgi:hypothetical protein